MIEIWLAAGALAALAVISVVWRARRPTRGGVNTDTAVAMFADRRREIAAEARVQGLGADEVAALEEEFALGLVVGEAPADAGDQADDNAGGNAGPPLAPLLAGAILAAAVAIGLYALWGEPNARVLATATALMAVADDDDSLAALEDALVARLDRKPGDVDGWFHLGHVRMRRSDFGGAASAFASLRELVDADQRVDLAWAQAAYLADDGQMSATTRAGVEQVLVAHPDHPLTLELLAMNAIRDADYATAASYLARILRQSLPARRRALLEQTLDLARTRLGDEQPMIEVAVSVEHAAAPWLMVFARPVGGGMPLAVVRRPARPFQTIILDDAESMNPASRLSMAGAVEVVARLSEDGAALSRGLEVVSEVVDATARPRLTLRLQGEVASVAANAGDSIIIEVSLAADLNPTTPIFVIARDPGAPMPPVAVRRLLASDLPTRIELTDADAMLPGRPLSRLAEVELLARASLSGGASARSGDLESPAMVIKPGAGPIVLRIHRPVP